MIGRTYLLRGRPVVVVARWAGSGPRNVWIRHEDGTQDVRPFRGLRKLSAGLAPSVPASGGKTESERSLVVPAPAPVSTPSQGR